MAALFAAGCGPELDGDVSKLGQSQSELKKREPNNLPVSNGGGFAANFSTDGHVALDSEFSKAQGSNGRTCATCHVPEDGWGITPATVQRFFDETDGLHPIFANRLDADKPSAPVGTVEERRSSFTMLLQGKFIRRVNLSSSAEYVIQSAQDPFGEGTLTRFQFFRRPPPTANFKSHTVMWDAANTVGTNLRAGLEQQARGNVTGAQQGPPASQAVIKDIVDFEMNMSHAQLVVPGAGRLDSDGAKGGPEHHANQALVAGRFDLYDAWINHENPSRAQIARGQELFNGVNAANGRSCQGCHNAKNSGQNVNGVLFNVGSSDPKWAKSDMAVYILRNKTTGQLLGTTDPGRGVRTGKWTDLNRFKTPTLRGLAARPPYFHNGIATTLDDVVRFYEESLGFRYTDQEREDLVAFMNAL